MKIHVVHSKSHDFKNELYKPLRNSELNKEHQIFLPHETEELIKTKELIKQADVIIAEASFPATGLGIQLGWADAFDRPIICLYKSGSEVSDFLKAMCKVFIEYSNSGELVTRLSEALDNFKV